MDSSSVSEDDLSSLFRLLDKQQKGIEVLTDILQYVCVTRVSDVPGKI